MLKSVPFNQTHAFSLLTKHKEEIAQTTIKDLFKEDSERFDKFSIRFEDILLDYSKNIITEKTKAILVALANECELDDAIERMFTGDVINKTENRAVLHVALRNRSNSPIGVDGKEIMPEINAVLEKMKGFSEKVISGDWKGYSGKAITDVVNIGIGGSDLGPVMVTEALKPYKNQ